MKVKIAYKEGNENSGNHGHAGRPGEVGGSMPGDSSIPLTPKQKAIEKLRAQVSGWKKEFTPVPLYGVHKDLYQSGVAWTSANGKNRVAIYRHEEGKSSFYTVQREEFMSGPGWIIGGRRYTFEDAIYQTNAKDAQKYSAYEAYRIAAMEVQRVAEHTGDTVEASKLGVW